MVDIKIPKIIHQLWIGPKPAPTVFMNTWKEKHEPLGFEYKFGMKKVYKRKSTYQSVEKGLIVLKKLMVKQIFYDGKFYINLVVYL